MSPQGTGFSLGWNSLWHVEPQAGGSMDLNSKAHLKCTLFPILYSKAKLNNNNNSKKKKGMIFQVEIWLLDIPGGSMVKRLSTMWETGVWSLGWEDLLEKEMAIHSSTIAWKIPWTEEPGRLQSMGSQRVGHDWATSRSRWFRNCLFVQPLYCPQSSVASLPVYTVFLSICGGCLYRLF